MRFLAFLTGAYGDPEIGRLSCRSFAANAVRLQLHALVYNLANFLRMVTTPEPIRDWSLTTLKGKLIKIGAKIIGHALCRVRDGRGRDFEELVQPIAKLLRRQAEL